MVLLIIAVVLAVILAITGSVLIKDKRFYGIAAYAGAAIVLVLGLALSSVYFVDSDKVGIVDKYWGGASLAEGRIIAVEGENGIQAEILRAGLHWWKFAWQLRIEQVPLVQVNPGEIGIIETKDGSPMPPNQVFAPEWDKDEVKKMLEAKNFLTDGQGIKGPQLTVLGPGQYAVNTKLYTINPVPITTIDKGFIGVVKANVPGIPSTLKQVFEPLNLDGAPYPEGTVKPGNVGVWGVTLPPGKYWVHPEAFEVTAVDIRKQTINFLGETGQGKEAETSAVRVKAKDGFQFYIDNTVIYHVEPEDAPRVVAIVGDPTRIREVVISQNRKTMRDKVGETETLSYVNDRVMQQKVATEALSKVLAPYGVTVDDVNIRDMYDQQLEALLKTQSEREIAKQQQVTFEQQKVAAQKQQELNAARQAAEEEKSLQTAIYDVQREEQSKKRVIIKAEADAEQVRIKAQADADAIKLKGDAEAERYEKIVKALGESNATAIEIIERVRDEIGKIQLPDTLVMGGGAGGTDEAIGARVLQLLSPQNKPPVK